jgi:hypothetical protein
MSKIKIEISKHFPKHIDNSDLQWSGIINNNEIVVMNDESDYSVFSSAGYHGTMELNFTMTELKHVANYKGRKYNLKES